MTMFRVKHSINPMNPICLNSFRINSAWNTPQSESNPDLLRRIWENPTSLWWMRSFSSNWIDLG